MGEATQDRYAHPDFFKDAARIYISQKSDIDDYFDLAKGKIGNHKSKSAIAMKADGIRIIGREGVKIVTKSQGKNSADGSLNFAGIDLIALNNTDNTNTADLSIQPLVKGDNVLKAIKELAELQEKLRGVLYHFMDAQNSFNEKLKVHQHYSPYQFKVPFEKTYISDEAYEEGMKINIKLTFTDMPSLKAHRINLKMWKQKYLETHGEFFINSMFNNTN